MTSINLRLVAASGFASILCALLLLAPSPGAAQSGSSEFISSQVAIVSGDILTEQELFFTLMREYGNGMVDDLVENEILASHADEFGVALEPNEVEEYLSAAYADEKFDALSGAFGRDVLERAVGTELLALRVVSAKIDQVISAHGIEITDETIREVYISKLPLWTEPAAVRFSLIESDTEAEVVAARQRIVNGETFADVCHDVSTHAGTRAYDGDIGGLVPEGYSSGDRVRLEEAAFALSIGSVSEAIEVEDRWYIIMPTEKREYNEPTLDELREYIHAGLLDSEVEPYLEEWRAGIWESADIEVSYPIYLEIGASSFTPGAGGSFIAPTVAIVNGRSIPEGELFFHLLRQHGSLVIEALVENILFVQAGAAMGISRTETEAASQLAQIYDSGKLELLSAAFSMDALVASVQRELTAIEVMGTKIQEIVEEQDIEITEDEILQYYLDNLSRWTRPEMVRFSIIVLELEEEAVAARARIAGGESFEGVCREVSLDENTRPYGGDIGDYIPRNFARGENIVIEETAFNLPIGAVSDPFQVGASWFLIKVTDSVDAYEPTLSEKREDISLRLLQDRVAPFVQGWRRNLWEAADIEVVYPIYTDTPSPEFNGGGDMWTGD